MNTLKKQHDGFPPLVPKWLIGTGVGVLAASICAGVYCLVTAENAEKGGDLATPETAHKIIDTPEKR